MKTQLLNSVIAKKKVICQCLADQLFTSAFSFGKQLIYSSTDIYHTIFSSTWSNNC